MTFLDHMTVVDRLEIGACLMFLFGFICWQDYHLRRLQKELDQLRRFLDTSGNTIVTEDAAKHLAKSNAKAIAIGYGAYAGSGSEKRDDDSEKQ